MDASEHNLQIGSNLHSFSQRLLHASYQKAAEFKHHVPSLELIHLLDQATALLKQEPTLLELTMEADCRVLMVGDTHGQLHDVVHMMELMGPPSQNQMYVFNGDFVDRGAWGVELLALLVSLKLEHRARVHLLRGNHEGSTCTRFYGFKGELDAKYGGPESRAVYAAYKRVFAVLPLAALVHGKTLILHGGLFRYVPPPEPKEQQQGRGKGGSKAKRRRVAADPLAPLRIGDLSVLRGASKGGVDPDGRGSSAVAADVLWSDPVLEPGLRENELRGVGLTFGPDITQAFLEANDLRLILRSHEGPDARDRRDDMPQVLHGYALDHDTPAGWLMTVFSAPDYPQFMPSHEARYNNKGAVAVLSGPTWHEPHMVSFEAARPRPEATAFYEYKTYPDTDDELMAEELGAAASSQGGGSSMSEGGALVRGDEEITSQVTPEIMGPGCSAPLGLLAGAGGVQGLLHAYTQPVLLPAAGLTPAWEGARASTSEAAAIGGPATSEAAAARGAPAAIGAPATSEAAAARGAPATSGVPGTSVAPDTTATSGAPSTSGVPATTSRPTAGAPAMPAKATAAATGPIPLAAPSHPPSQAHAPSQAPPQDVPQGAPSQALHPPSQAPAQEAPQDPAASPGYTTAPPLVTPSCHATIAPPSAAPSACHTTAPPPAPSASEREGTSEQGRAHDARVAPASQTTSHLASSPHSALLAAPATKAEPAPAPASCAAAVRGAPACRPLPELDFTQSVLGGSAESQRSEAAGFHPECSRAVVDGAAEDQEGGCQEAVTMPQGVSTAQADARTPLSTTLGLSISSPDVDGSRSTAQVTANSQHSVRGGGTGVGALAVQDRQQQVLSPGMQQQVQQGAQHAQPQQQDEQHSVRPTILQQQLQQQQGCEPPAQTSHDRCHEQPRATDMAAPSSHAAHTAAPSSHVAAAAAAASPGSQEGQQQGQGHNSLLQGAGSHGLGDEGVEGQACVQSLCAAQQPAQA